jgi:Tol biopolymer transport system component
MQMTSSDKKHIWQNFIPIGLLLIMLVLVGCSPEDRRVPQSPLLAKVERKSGAIVYIGVDGNIYTMDQGGGRQQQITTDARYATEEDSSILIYQAPTWSPDNQQLAFIGVRGSEESGSRIEEASLYTVSLGDLEIVETYSSDYYFPFYLYWSPDSQKIGFLSNTNFSRGFALFSAPPGGPALMLDAGRPYFWSWAPNSKKLLVHAGGFSPTVSAERISFLNVGGSSVEESVTSLMPWNFQAPSWTSDGEHVLVAASIDNRSSLVMLDKNGRLERTLTDFVGEIAFSLSPDGEQVAMISGINFQSDFLQGKMKVFDLDDPANSYETEEDNVFAFFWSPDSQQIAYFSYQIINVAPPGEDGQPDENIPPVATQTVQVDIMDVGNNGETHDVTHPFPPTEQFISVLSLFSQYQHSATIWSPDSQNLVLSAYLPDGSPVIWVVRSTGRLEPRYLVNGVLAFWSWE